jgi:hypothetical protein
MAVQSVASHFTADTLLKFSVFRHINDLGGGELSAHILMQQKVKLSLCLTKHHAMKMYWGSGGIAPRTIDLGTRWRWVVSFTPRPFYPQGKSPWYVLDRRLCGPQNRSGCSGEEKNSQLPQAIEP